MSEDEVAENFDEVDDPGPQFCTGQPGEKRQRDEGKDAEESGRKVQKI